MDEFQKLKESFFQEADDILEGIDHDLMDLENDPENSELLNGIFRNMHTLKGSSGIFEFHTLERFAHIQEDLLDYLRSEGMAPTKEMLDILFDCLDVTRAILALLKEGEDVDDSICAEMEPKLRAFLPKKEDVEVASGVVSSDPGIDDLFIASLSDECSKQVETAAKDGKRIYQVGLKLNKYCFNKAIDPLTILKSIAYDGEVLGVSSDGDKVPDLNNLDPMLLYFDDIKFLYISSLGLDEVDELFNFAQDAGTTELHQLSPNEIKEGFGVEFDDFWLDSKEVVEEAPVTADTEAFDPVIFHAELQGNLDELEVLILKLEKDHGDEEVLNNVFRLFHNIKGNSEIFSVHDVAHIAHSAESILDNVRAKKTELTPHIIETLLETIDELKGLVSVMIDSATGAVGGEVREVNNNGIAKKLGEILVEMGDITEDELNKALEKQKTPPLGEILVTDGVVSKSKVKKALEKQKRQGIAQQSAVRIDTSKLDNIVNLVGELVITQTMLTNSPYIKAARDHNFTKIISQLDKITRNIQGEIMGMRMLPIKGTFQKIMRVARDVSRKAGREVEMIMSGEDTELDKTVIEEIGDPLVHIIRNAIDHGIESPEDRVKAGKSPKGHVSLKAFHSGGNIVIEISDDGKGLNREKIIAKAIKNKMITKGEELSDERIYDLIMQPGFSTADAITDLSGRGVGMDVVKKNVEKLRGKIEMSSVEGEGTTLKIMLPLTLAIIDGMLVGVGKERYIIPTLSIIESFQATKEQLFTIKGEGEAVKLRENVYPLVRLHELFGVKAHKEEATEGIVIHLEGAGKKACVLVDDILGQQQVVIKTLGNAFRKVGGISGSAILGDGRVGLILDPGGILDMSMAAN